MNNDKTPLLSFVLPAYKGKWLKRAIDSILAQTYTTIELVIVNDVSPDDLDSIVRSYDDVRIRYYKNKENLGGKSLIAQWEYCVSLAHGEYLVMAADDDIYHPLFAERCFELIQRYPECDLVRARVAQIDEAGKLLGVDHTFPEFISQIEYAYRYREGSAFICMGNFFFKTETLRRKGFVDFPCALCSDIATSIEMAENGMLNTDEMLFYFRQSTVHLSGSTARNKEKIEAITRFFDWMSAYKFKTPKNEYEQYYLSHMQTRDWHEKCVYDYFNQVIRTVSLSQLPVFFSLAVRATAREKIMMMLRWLRRRLLN